VDNELWMFIPYDTNCLWFQKFIELEGCLVLLSDNKYCKINGVGTIKFLLHDGIERVLEEVRFVLA